MPPLRRLFLGSPSSALPRLSRARSFMLGRESTALLTLTRIEGVSYIGVLLLLGFVMLLVTLIRVVHAGGLQVR